MAKKKLTHEQVMAFLRKEKQKYDEEQEFQKAVKAVYSRPKLTQTVKKAAHQAPGGLDCFKDENRIHSKESTDKWLSGSSYMENYNAMKDQDSWE